MCEKSRHVAHTLMEQGGSMEMPEGNVGMLEEKKRGTKDVDMSWCAGRHKSQVATRIYTIHGGLRCLAVVRCRHL